MYAQEYLNHVSSKEINLQIYLGLMTLFAFVRQLLSYQVTQTLGPIISTIIVMFSDVAQFILIWIFNLLASTVVSFLTF